MDLTLVLVHKIFKCHDFYIAFKQEICVGDLILYILLKTEIILFLLKKKNKNYFLEIQKVKNKINKTLVR